MNEVTLPDYNGGSLVNLVAEIEYRLTGSSASKRLHPEIAALIPEADTYVLVLYDGLGARQLDHPRAASMRNSLAAEIDAPFPTTTTVSLATIATGLPASQHGLLGYQLWLPERGVVANTIKWTTLWGETIDYDTVPFLPAPNLWERLQHAGVEPITIQPAHFADTPLTRLLYRECRLDGVYDLAELVTATLQLAATPSRLILAYVPHIDFAAHVDGQASTAYADAMGAADWVWSRLAATAPPGCVVIGTADHGHIDYTKGQHAAISRADHADRTFYGDSRAMFVRGEGASLAEELPATWHAAADTEDWWGPGPRHPQFEQRAPDGILLAESDRLLLHKRSDDRLIGNHGGLSEAERRIPLLVAR